MSRLSLPFVQALAATALPFGGAILASYLVNFDTADWAFSCPASRNPHASAR
jgi:hypothetical protein